MAMIHVNRGATSLGVFSEEQIRKGLRTGRFAASDIGWREGMANWQPLSQFAEFADIQAGAAGVPPLQTGAPLPPGTTTAAKARPFGEAVLPLLQLVCRRTPQIAKVAASLPFLRASQCRWQQ